jgi:hypothetical protein
MRLPMKIASTKSLKKIAVSGLMLAGVVAIAGCSTPVYSSKERGQKIARNMGLEWQMLQDDVDNILLLRPLSQGTRWNIR